MYNIIQCIYTHSAHHLLHWLWTSRCPCLRKEWVLCWWSPSKRCGQSVPHRAATRWGPGPSSVDDAATSPSAIAYAALYTSYWRPSGVVGREGEVVGGRDGGREKKGEREGWKETGRKREGEGERKGKRKIERDRERQTEKENDREEREAGHVISNQQNGIVIIRTRVLEGNSVPLHVREILFGLLSGAGAQSFVVLHLPGVGILCGLSPVLKLGEREEGHFLMAFGHLHSTTTTTLHC